MGGIRVSMIKKNKWLNVSITAALAVGVLAGCASNDGKNNTNQTAGNDKKQEPITLTWFDSNTKGEPFTDAIAQEITKKQAFRSQSSSQRVILRKS